MRAVLCLHPKAVLAPAPRVPSARARDARAVPARRVSSNYRAAVGGGPSAPTRGETCSTSSSAGDGAVTSHVSREAGEDWRVNAFSSFCDAASARPRVAAGLRALAQRHPGLDPSMVLFVAPPPTLLAGDDARGARGGGASRERWRARRQVAHRARLVARSDPKTPAAGAAPPRRRRAADARRRAAELFLEAERWRRFDAPARLLDTGATGENDRSTPFAEGTHVRGATATACANLRLLLEYLGAPLSRTDWKHARVVFEGCMAEGGERLAGGGWDVEGDVRVWGDADGDDDGEDSRQILTAKQWRSVRGAIDNRFADAKTALRMDRNERHRLAKKNLEHANRLWKETAAEYKRARTLVKSARHEVHKSRAAVRTQFR